MNVKCICRSFALTSAGLNNPQSVAKGDGCKSCRLGTPVSGTPEPDLRLRARNCIATGISGNIIPVHSHAEAELHLTARQRLRTKYSLWRRRPVASHQPHRKGEAAP